MDDVDDFDDENFYLIRFDQKISFSQPIFLRYLPLCSLRADFTIVEEFKGERKR